MSGKIRKCFYCETAVQHENCESNTSSSIWGKWVQDRPFVQIGNCDENKWVTCIWICKECFDNIAPEDMLEHFRNNTPQQSTVNASGCLM